MDFSSFKTLLLILVGLLAAGARAAEPVSEDKVREDLDRQLREMVRTTPPEVVVSFQGLAASEGYKLLEAEFLLDGEPLIVPGPDTLNAPGTHRLAVLQVAEGAHTLVSRVTYVNDSWSLFSETSGRLWKMTASIGFQAQRGLRVKAKVVPGIVPNAPDPRLKLKLAHDVTAEMTAPLADVRPEPPPSATTPPPQAAQATATTQQSEPQAPQAPAGASRLVLKVTARAKPVDATVYLRGGGKPRQLSLNRKERKPKPLEVAPGAYTVEVVAPGYLAQARRVEFTQGREAKLSFALIRAPAKKKQARVTGTQVELPKPPRFAERKAAPSKGSTAALPLLVDLLVREGGARLRIEGHTDSREGSLESRKQLSEARAKALADLLVRAGVDAARIEAAGLGDSRPKAPNFTPLGRQLNRRVEFILLPK